MSSEQKAHFTHFKSPTFVDVENDGVTTALGSVSWQYMLGAGGNVYHMLIFTSDEQV